MKSFFVYHRIINGIMLLAVIFSALFGGVSTNAKAQDGNLSFTFQQEASKTSVIPYDKLPVKYAKSNVNLIFPSFELPYEQKDNNPVKWTGGPHAYNLGGKFGDPYISGEGSGLDFSNGGHFEVLNMASGDVVEASCAGYGSLGCIVAIKHDVGGTVMIYAHLEPSSVDALIDYFKFKRDYGRGPLWLSQGSVIGKAGNSGNQAKVHLHIELRDGNQDQNGNWVCFLQPPRPSQCIKGNLGGNPIGWDDGLFLVDGYQIFGYIADPEGLNSYNYDGSAVKGPVKLIEDKSFLYNDSGTLKSPWVVRVGDDFSCMSPQKDCELPENHLPHDTKLTQFARDDGKGGLTLDSITLLQQTASTPYGAGVLESTNQPSYIQPPDYQDDASSFISDITIPDGTLVSPNQSLTKTWRVKNIGTSTWGSGYKLVFVDGEQMGVPLVSNVPSTAPNTTLDLSVPLTTPAAAGNHSGYFQLRNPQGTYFGPKISVKINVQSSSSQIGIFTVDPASPSNTNQVTIRAQVNNMPNFRAMRILIDGNPICELGAPEINCTWNTSGYSAGEHNIVVQAADNSDASWSRPQQSGMLYTLTGTSESNNHAPNRPTLFANPAYDWYVYYSGNSAQLCAQENGDPDDDSITGYYFDIYNSAQNWNSGWIGSNCVTAEGLGPYTYQWRAKVRDNRGAESDWSDSWHFSIVNSNLSISQFDFLPQDSNSEQVKIAACTSGQGGVNITMRVSVNDASDGSDHGQWHYIYELGVPCFNSIDMPTWNTLDYGDGTHLVRVEAHGGNTGWDGSTAQQRTYTLPHRRPAGPNQRAPVPQSQNSNEAIYLNSRTVNFIWASKLRSNTYTLHIGTTSSPQDDPNPVFRQTFASNVNQTPVLFSQDYPQLYWQVTASGDVGSSSSNAQLFGIDQTAPICTIQSLPLVSYENTFQVSWNSTDDLSGVRLYDIQFLDSSRSEWFDWKGDLPVSKTFDLFTGEPGHTYSFRCRATDNANNQSQYPSIADTFTKIDPASRPLTPWWNTSYVFKRNLVILNNDPNGLPIHYPIHLHFDGSTTPTASEIYNASRSVNKGDDVRIIYQNSVELDRTVRAFTDSQIDIWFPLQADLASSGSDNTNYQIYYGNTDPGIPPSNVNAVFLPIADANTVGLWHFQEGSGTMVSDSSGLSHHASFSNAGWADGFTGWAGSFNGVNSSVTIPGSDDFNSTAMTLEAWIYISTFNGQWSPILHKRIPYNPGGFEFRLTNDHQIMLINDVTTGNWDVRSDPLQTGRWYHVAGTFNGSNQSCIYVNGVQVRCRNITPGQPKFNNAPVTIGFAHEGSGDISFPGYIQHVRISNIARTDFSSNRIANLPSTAAGIEINPPIQGQADLTIQALNTYPNSGGGVLVEATVKNQGSVSTTNGFYTDLYIDHLPTGVGDYTGSLRFWVNDPILPNGSATLTTLITDLSGLGVTTFSLPIETSGTLYVQTDSTGAVAEADKQNNIYSSGTPICLAESDEFGADDTFSAASTIVPGIPQIHNFNKMGDQDWVKFAATAGETYRITTSVLGLASDTYLYLYGTDGTTLLASNDDYGNTLASQIEWQAPSSGTYYILVNHWNPNIGGCGTQYAISVNGSDIFISGNAGVGGATLSYTDGTPQTTTADGSGNYLFSVSNNWSGTVTPAKTGYTFSPVNRSYTNLQTDQIAQDYTATFITYTISGNAGLANANLSYLAGTPQTATADGGGNYSITVSSGWNGTVTPWKSGYGFTPTSRTYANVLADQLVQDYTSFACSTTDVTIAGVLSGSNCLTSGQSTRQSYAVNNGPVKVFNTGGLPILTAQRILYYGTGTAPTSFVEMMGLPDGQMDNTYWFPWYKNDGIVDTQIRIGNVSASTATVHIFVAGVEVTGSPFTLTTSGSGQSQRLSFALNDGPVKIVSDQNIVATERLIYFNSGTPISFSEMLGLPNSQLSNTYWFPWYKNAGEVDTQLRIGNVSASTATVHIYIAGVEVAGSPFTLTASGAGQSQRLSFPINNGPVKIVSDVNIVAAQRILYYAGGVPTSFVETMGIPDSQLGTTHWFPWYKNDGIVDTQLRIGNVSGTAASVHVYIGTAEMAGSPFTLTATGAGQSLRLSFTANDGPVKIVSDQNIVTSERLLYFSSGTPVSFSEMMGLPDSQLSTTYWLPWYKNIGEIDTQLRFGVP